MRPLKRGYAALLSTLIIAATLIASMASLFALSYLARSSALGQESKQRSASAAASCLSAALHAYATAPDSGDDSYPETLTLDSIQSCVIEQITETATSTAIRVHAATNGSFSVLDATIVPSSGEVPFTSVSLKKS